MKRPRRIASSLSESIQRQLNMYALAASAAGVGILALAQPSGAKIVYTPAHMRVSDNSMVPLDLNHDGINDFTFKDQFLTFGGDSTRGYLKVVHDRRGNAIWGHLNSASALLAGVHIGSGGPFSTGHEFMAGMAATFGGLHTYGPWSNAKNRYLGLKFSVHGKTHYGWARLNVSNGYLGVAAVVTGYGYETIPNKAILAGKTTGRDEMDPHTTTAATRPAKTLKPATLGALAMGAPGLSIWRRKESEASMP